MTSTHLLVLTRLWPNRQDKRLLIRGTLKNASSKPVRGKSHGCGTLTGSKPVRGRFHGSGMLTTKEALDT